MWYNIIKERKVLKMRKPKLSEKTIKELYNKGEAYSKNYEYEVTGEWNEDLNAYEDYLYRWDKEYNHEKWLIPAEGIWAFQK